MEAGTDTALSEVPLQRGASLIGEVTTAEGPADPEIVRVRIEPLRSGGAPKELSEDLSRQLGVVTTVNTYGFFVVDGITPGMYVVIARQPGYAPARVTPVELREGQETALRDPLVLEPLASVEVQVRPPSYELAQPWRLTLLRESSVGRQREAASGVTDPRGRWRVSDLEPGRYHLRVEGPGEGITSEEGPFPVAGAEPVFVPVDLDLVQVSGTVELGDEPLGDARLWFGSSNAATRVRGATDDQGRFTATLPKAGVWNVEITADEPPLHRKTYRVDVPDKGGELALRIPDTTVHGRVQTEAGEPPASPAVVKIARLDEPAGAYGTRTGKTGRFELHGLEPGAYAVAASAEGADSEPSTLAIAESGNSPDLLLTLHQTREIELTLTADGTGAPGVEVDVMPLTSTGALPMQYPHGTTDAEGVLHLTVPARTDRLQVTAFPLGHGLTTAWTSPADRRLEVARPDGALQLISRADGEEEGVDVVLIDGVPMGRPTLATWAQMNRASRNDGRLLVPAMPAGNYLYCVVTAEEIVPVVTGAVLPGRCSRGTLVPGSILDLTRP